MIREIISNDILTILLFLSVFLILIIKKIDSVKFKNTFSLYKNGINFNMNSNSYGLKSTINILYYVIFLLNFSLILTFWKLNKFKLETYLSIIITIFVFYSVKFFINLIIAILFNLKKDLKSLIFSKLVSKIYIGIIFLSFNFIISFLKVSNEKIILIFVLISLSLLIFSYLSVFISMKKIIYKNWFYFILYLCTLEIIPYYLLFNNIL